MAEAIWVFFLALLTAVATGLGALPFLFFESPTRSWPGFAAGAMVWMVFTELVPDALEEADGATVNVVALSAAAMVAFQFLIR